MTVISPEELRERAPGLRWVDARSGAEGARAYARSHLAGAVHADLDRDLSAPADNPARGGRHPLPPLSAFARTLGRWGIGPDTEVVVYDDVGGANAAARLWWMLRAVGHRRVAVLDGGWQAAVDAGLPTTGEPPNITPGPLYPAEGYALPTADLRQVSRLARDPSWMVLDVREPARYRGEHEPIDPVAGHIPGAANLFFGENLGSHGRFKTAAELRAQYEALLRDVPPERLVVSCGSGVTACHTLLALERAGLGGASLYVGSWSEWCRARGKSSGG